MNRLIAMQAETVIVADDHPLFRTAIKEALDVLRSKGEYMRLLTGPSAAEREKAKSG